MSRLIETFERYALISIEKQKKLSKLIGEHFWELDLDAGTVRFNDYRFPFQVLGTESDNTLTYLWAWAEEQTEIPENLLASSRRLRAWGEKEGLKEFTTPSVDMNNADGHMLSLISSAVCEASAYYRGPYDAGAVFFIVFGNNIDIQPDLDMLGLSHSLAWLTSIYDFNHKNALISYLVAKHIPFTEKEGLITASLGSGEYISAMFDGSGRLLTVNGKAVPDQDDGDRM